MKFVREVNMCLKMIFNTYGMSKASKNYNLLMLNLLFLNFLFLNFLFLNRLAHIFHSSLIFFSRILGASHPTHCDWGHIQRDVFRYL